MAFLYDQISLIRGLTIAQQNQILATYHKNPERAAWTILLAALVILCILITGVFWGGNWYVTNAKDHFTATVTSINGTVLAKSISTDSPIPILLSNQLEVAELTIVSTDDTSQAVLTFFDDSAITLYSNTTLIIQQSNRPRFKWSSQPDLIEVEIVKGRIRATPFDQAERRTFIVKTPHAQTQLAPGSYAVEANNQQTQITVRLGMAEVSAQDTVVQLGEGQLTTVLQKMPPSDPTEAEQNLLINSDFSQGLAETWVSDIFVAENSTDVITATVELKTADGRSVLEFASQGEDNIHTDAAIEQVIDKDVRDFQSLRINADVMLNYQSLPGGGFQGTEFPIRIKLSYKDADGNDRDWYHGFYYEPPPDNYILYDQVDNAGENISQNLWYPYESENLLETLADIKPVYVKSIRIYASGWIYKAMVADVKLLAQD